MKYQVKRHGGNVNHEWKVILDTDDRQKAISKYDKVAIDLRQGSVAIFEDGEKIGMIMAPRLRRRW